MGDDDETRKAAPPRHSQVLDALDAIRCALPEVKFAAARFAVAMRRRDYDAAAIAADHAVALLLAAKAALRRAASNAPSAEPETREMRHAFSAREK